MVFDLENFIKWLMKQGYAVLAPVETKEGVEIQKVDDPRQVKFLNKLPLHSFKRFLLPPCEELFSLSFQGAAATKQSRVITGSPRFARDDNRKQALFGLTVLDLQALLLQQRIFTNDPYFQARLKNTLIIGQSLMPRARGENFFDIKYKRENLKHLPFDVFFETINRGNSSGARGVSSVFSGSQRGQKILKDFGFKKYQHIEFIGPSPKINEMYRMTKIKKAMESKFKLKIWQALMKRCIECGKCTIACPTCFCFRIDDEPDSDQTASLHILRKRCLDSCFYQEFSEVAGNAPAAPKNYFLKDTAQRIFFWYEHHFIRMPRDAGVPGCVGCGRCFRACPVFINIEEEIQKILRNNENTTKATKKSLI